jgi:Zn-dependent protease with chaperone function
MTLSYSLRLLSLCFASFFLVHAVAGIAVVSAQRRAARFAERTTARSAARLLFGMRLLPAAIALVFVFGVCMPGYVQFEPNFAGEEVGFVCLGLAILGFVQVLIAIARGFRVAVHSARFVRLCRTCGRLVHLAGQPSEMFVVPGTRPFLMQSGVFRAQLAISERLLNEFPSAELEAALGHERAHWISRDNLKRLLLAFLPGILPFWAGFDPLERGWAKFTERAADDCVSAKGAEPAVSLAAALVRLARLRGPVEPLAWMARAASSLGGSDDLQGRVQRLVTPAPTVAPAGSDFSGLLWSVGTLLAGVCAAALASPVLQWSVHELLERLMH